MNLGLIVILGIILASPVVCSRANGAEKWNFTPTDYKRLRTEGRDLSIHLDSRWMPRILEESLLRTVRWSLSQVPSSTDGVNVDDLYHGHYLCRKPVDRQIEEVSRAVQRYYEQVVKRVVDRDGQLVTSDNFGQYIKGIQKAEDIAGKMVDAVHDSGLCEGEAILLHSFEREGPPGMRNGDPRRNILFVLDAMLPVGYSPPDIDDASSYVRDYDSPLQFMFLIDRKGQLHATVGFKRDLSRILGYPANF